MWLLVTAAAVLTSSTVTSSAVTSASATASSDFDLTVLHVNDIHVRFEETNKYSGNCKQEDMDKGGCYGGIPRLAAAVKDIRSKEKNVIFLNGGDFYQGNVWYTHFKWRIVAQFGNLLNFTAMAPGNHEFDDHVSGFVPFLRNVTFPVVCANMDISREPSLEGLFSPSVVVDVGGRQVGIIGYVTTDTPVISNADKVGFIDEVEAIRQEAARLTDAGVDILIALGHSGFDRDQEIAREVPQLDLVVGGHSHSLLYTGTPPSVEKPQGPYPTMVTQASGRQVAVVQAYAFTKYIGRFKMTFDQRGELKAYEGQPILLDNSYPQDESVLRALQPWKREVEELAREVVAETRVLLLQKGGEETNIGNLITDSMVDWFAMKHNVSGEWTSVSLAIINSGGIRSSFEVGNITVGDMLTVLPFQNSVDIITVKGKFLKQAFENIASKMAGDANASSGYYRFIQVSGFQMLFDLCRSPGDRLTQILVRCAKCSMPKFQPLDMEAMYDVATVGYLAEGGDGHTAISDNKVRHLQGPLDTDVFREYVARRSPITQGLENRMVILGKDKGACTGTGTPTTSSISASLHSHAQPHLLLAPAAAVMAVLRSRYAS